ncbi:hypothetical protein Sme01_35330 [Sphaerisporangium melleum]|uniref:Uncharacterized protein n=1 Tax=Sphaerisporangium melleum TaxID=321316 RepID=A0A917VMV2_9ACTN|nr:hypothetical protein [Sphaerisporangium melleum]GGK96998.1 hypothetical protein GCM10007964_43990 [Sphaerisporangium melleum]GII71057.1 hypothetical protein Sme01_35330 [Sphaerisporangium melleum]
MTKMSRRLVVDASVARAAGTTENPTSVLCREFLLAISKVGHKLVMTREIGAEWRKHRSNFAVIWFASMQRRNKILRLTPEGDLLAALLAALDDMELSEKNKSAIRKDLLLVVAAEAADGSIASLDDRMRKLLGHFADEAKVVGSMVWVNPARPEEEACRWLEAGARTEDSRKIENYKAAVDGVGADLRSGVEQSQR